MQRLSLEFVRPDMILARDVYDQDGAIMIAADAKLTDRLIDRLRSREIASVFVRNPRIQLPEISDAVQEETRNRARLLVEQAFTIIRRAGRISLSDEEQTIVHDIVRETTQDPRSVFHLAHINRHSRDILAHSVNVALLSTATGMALGMQPSPELYDLALSALLHDIGQLMIPCDLLLRQSSLNPQELAIFREHTNWGFTLLRQASDLPSCAASVAQEHHEHADGTGYPQQLTVDMLHPFSRIVAAVNSYESMCAGTACGSGQQVHLAYEALSSGAGTCFSLDVAKSLLSRLPMYPLGTTLELTDGSIGVVVSIPAALPHRPALNMLTGTDGAALKKTFTLDLAARENQTLFIKEILNDDRTANLISAET